VTPYLVRPVSGHLAMPTDGFRAPSDPVRVLEGQSYSSQGRSPAPAPATPRETAATRAARAKAPTIVTLPFLRGDIEITLLSCLTGLTLTLGEA